MSLIEGLGLGKLSFFKHADNFGPLLSPYLVSHKEETGSKNTSAATI